MTKLIALSFVVVLSLAQQSWSAPFQRRHFASWNHSNSNSDKNWYETSSESDVYPQTEAVADQLNLLNPSNKYSCDVKIFALENNRDDKMLIYDIQNCAVQP